MTYGEYLPLRDAVDLNSVPPSASPGDRIEMARHRIQGRIESLGRQRETFIAHHQNCVDEQDWHGAWDGAVGIAELEIETTGLQFAIDALGAE